jgi:site-specific DNA recombinase
VRRVLTNPRYCGIRAHRSVEYGPAKWPSIVPEETYWPRSSSSVIPHAVPSGGAGRDGVQLLTGLALCVADGCRQTVHGRGASHKKPICRCRTSATPAGELPHVPGPHLNRLAEPVDDLVERLVIDRLSSPDAHELLVDHDRADVPALRDEANAFRGRLDTLAMEFADGELTASQLGLATDRLRARLAVIDAQIADAGRLDLLGPLLTAEECATAWGH